MKFFFLLRSHEVELGPTLYTKQRAYGYTYIYLYINIGRSTIESESIQWSRALGHCPTSYTNDVKAAGINDYILAMSLFRIFKILKYSIFGHQLIWPFNKWHRVDKWSTSCVLAAAKGARIIWNGNIYIYKWGLRSYARSRNPCWHGTSKCFDPSVFTVEI